MAKQINQFQKTKISDRLFDTTNILIMIGIFVVMLYPFLNVLAIALNDSVDTVRGGIYIWPREFTLENFIQVFQYDTLLVAFRNSVLRTVIGTGLGLVATSMLAFALSRRDFKSRKLFSMIIILTMYFSGGLIPGYMVIRDLGLINSFWVYILPGMIAAWNVIIMRSFMDSVPYSLQESAKLDGASDFTIYLRIILHCVSLCWQR